MTHQDQTDWALHYAMSAMPAPLASALGARLAPLIGRKANPVADAEAAALFRALRTDLARDPVALEAALVRLWDCVGRSFAEYAVSLRMLRGGRVVIEGKSILDAALASGRPVIATFLHTGNFELSFMQVGLAAPGRATMIYDPPKAAARAAIAYKVRSQVPWELLPISKMIWRHGLARLRTPGGIFITASDEAVDGHIGGPFLGRPLRTDGNMGKVARLALRTGALVLPFYNERHPGTRFTTHFLPVFDFKGAADDEGAVREAVAALDASFAPAVLRLLDQWFTAFLYRRAAPDGWHGT